MTQLHKIQSLRDNAIAAVDNIFKILTDKGEGAKYEYLLGKKIFPDRKMPHRLKRKRKKAAGISRANRIGKAMVNVALAAAQSAIICSQPIPEYESGGVSSTREWIEESGHIDKDVFNNLKPRNETDI